MADLVSEAIVLHAFDYQESSRIFRLLTREAGIQSVLARSARMSKRRFGTSLDLFAQGTAEIQFRPNRELQTLVAMDVIRGRPQLALDVAKFTGASMTCELILRFTGDEAAPEVFAAVEDALDSIAAADASRAVEAALAGAWRIVSELGFAPELDSCANCHAEVPAGGALQFSHAAGGVVCGRCAHAFPGARSLPANAVDALRNWITDRAAPALSDPEARAHQRLLREFAEQHLGVTRELRAYRVWEQGNWSAA